MTRTEAYELALVALCIWRESRGEPDEGMIAVGCTIRERVHHPKWWGNSWATVVTKKWQFSSMTALYDSQLGKYPEDENDPIFQRCLEIAEAVMAGELEHPAPTATHFYVAGTAVPGWEARAQFIKQIGHHKFFYLES